MIRSSFHETDELVLLLKGNMEFEVAGRVCHSEIRKRASDLRWCHPFRSEHRGDHDTLALRVQELA